MKFTIRKRCRTFGPLLKYPPRIKSNQHPHVPGAAGVSHMTVISLNFSCKDLHSCESADSPTLILFLFAGEGFHNYHHTFPFDYSTSEFGCRLNLTTAFIDLMCLLGLATDCKRVSKDTIAARRQRTGDGSQTSG